MTKAQQNFKQQILDIPTWNVTLTNGKTEMVSNDVIGRYTIANRGLIEKMELIK